MKHKISAAASALALLLALTFALSGCSVPQTTSAAVPPDAAVSAPAPAATTEPPPAAPLRTLAPPRSYTSSNDAGYYGLCIVEEGYAFGWRLNFDTATQEKLCAVPGCTHTQNTCGALWNPDSTRFDGTILADTDKLYWLSWSGGSSNITEGSTSHPFVEVSDLDGANRRTLFTLPDGTYLRESPVVTDGETMYLVHLLSSTDPTQHDRRVLIGVDMDTGEIGLQYELTDISPSFLGAYDNKLLFGATTLTPDCPVQPVYASYNMLANPDDLLPYMRAGLFTLTTDGKQRETLYSVEAQYLDGMYLDGFVYKLDAQARTLTTTDIGTGEVSTLAENLPDNVSLDSIWKRYILLSTAYGPNGYGRTLHILNRATGEVRESPLRRMQKMEPSFPKVLCEKGDDFVVVCDQTPQTVTRYGMAGSVMQIELFVDSYALISQQAFWEGTPEYREITLLPDVGSNLL